MRITLKKINAFNKDIKKIKKLYSSSFPENERAPMWLLAMSAQNKNVDFWSLYCDGDWFGMAYVVSEGDFSYLFYLAVSQKMRGKGLGSAALRSLKLKYEGRRLFLALEQLDENAENYAERVKRRNFYLRNGFYPINYTIKEGAVTYDVMSVGGDVRPKEYNKMMKNFLGFPLNKLVSMDIKEKNVPRETFSEENT